MKKILYILITLLIIVITILVYLSSMSDSDPQIDEPTTFPQDSVVIPNPQSATFALKGTTGTIEVRNFFTDPLTKMDPVNVGHYQLGAFIDPTFVGSSDKSYYIEYIASTQYFIISLQSEPVSRARQDAEQFLLRHLDVTEDQLCNLNYMISVPARFNLQYAGQSLGFSFCPGAVTLQ